MNDVSVKERLKNKRKETGKNFDELLVLYGIERLLYRISVSEHSDQFILKGGALLYTLLDNDARMTRDIDVLARKLQNSRENIKSVMESICSISSDDALTFDKDSICVEDIAEDAEYHGVRFVITAYLGKAKIHLQMDIGFSDAVYPEPKKIEFPSLLKMDKPYMYAYPIEAVIAEKYEAMTSLGDKNSRFKDFYDIVMLSRNYDFDGRVLQEAMTSTFTGRNTQFSHHIYTNDFAANKERLWQGFKNRINSRLELTFEETLREIKKFIMPVQSAIEKGEHFSDFWTRKGWITAEKYNSNVDNSTIDLELLYKAIESMPDKDQEMLDLNHLIKIENREMAVSKMVNFLFKSGKTNEEITHLLSQIKKMAIDKLSQPQYEYFRDDRSHKK